MRRFTLPGLSATEIIIVVALGILLFFITFPLRYRDDKPRQTQCTSNQRQIATAIAMYAYEHEGTLPAADTVWQDLNINTKGLYCKVAGGKPRNTYGYNMYLSGQKLEKGVPFPANTMLTADIEVPVR